MYFYTVDSFSVPDYRVGKIGGDTYFFSWLDSVEGKRQLSWNAARSFCKVSISKMLDSTVSVFSSTHSAYKLFFEMKIFRFTFSPFALTWPLSNRSESTTCSTTESARVS